MTVLPACRSATSLRRAAPPGTWAGLLQFRLPFPNLPPSLPPLLPTCSLRRRYKLKTYEQRSYKNFDQQEKELAELKEKHKIKTAKRKAKASSKKD